MVQSVLLLINDVLVVCQCRVQIFPSRHDHVSMRQTCTFKNSSQIVWASFILSFCSVCTCAFSSSPDVSPILHSAHHWHHPQQKWRIDIVGESPEWMEETKYLLFIIYHLLKLNCVWFFHLELFFTAWIQRFFIQQLSVISVAAHFSLSFGFFCTSKAFQEVGIQSTNISIERLWRQQLKEMSHWFTHKDHTGINWT